MTDSDSPGSRMVALALAKVGRPYVWATAGPDQFDCSGLVWWAYNQVADQPADYGYRDSHLQYQWGEPVDADEMPAPGDLVFWDSAAGGEWRLGNNASHVGIDTGDGRTFVHAENPSTGVKVSTLADYDRMYPFLGRRRLFALELPAEMADMAAPSGGGTPAEIVPRLPDGPIKTPNQWNGGSFDVSWADVGVWLPMVLAIAETVDVPWPRLFGHLIMESQGISNAVQENQRGASYGLLQVVAAIHQTLIEQLTRAKYDDAESAGLAMIRSPWLAIETGAHVLRYAYEATGNWDTASSRFFLGVNDWAGADTVNFTRGASYRAALHGLMAELAEARDAA